MRQKTTRGNVRPTSGKILSALLAILDAAGRLQGARVLELFSGTGRVSAALLERGAASVTAVESDGEMARSLAELFAPWGERASLLRLDVRRALPRLNKGEPFDIVFADPPYEMGWGRELLSLMEKQWRIVAERGVFVFEHSQREKLPLPDFSSPYEREERVYGDTVLSFYWNGGKTLDQSCLPRVI